MSHGELSEVQYGLSTHPGPIKKQNEDRLFLRLAEVRKGRRVAIALVADGMGGLDSGDIASRVAVDMIKEWWDQTIHFLVNKPDLLSLIESEIRQLFHQMNRHLLDLKNKQGKRVGTTLSVLSLYGNRYRIHHIGDSRIYHFTHSGSQIKLLTEDHSWVQSQVNQGLLSYDEARLHPKRNVLLHCLGVSEEVVVHQRKGVIEPGDIFLLCSDGFYSPFSDIEILEWVCSSQSEGIELQHMSEILTNLALEAGTTDNVSAMLIKLDNRERKGWRGMFSSHLFQ